MISGFRGSWAKYVVMGIISFIALVFAIEGVFLGKGSDAGFASGSTAGTVNGESISLSEFNRAYEQKMQSMRSMLGGKITDDQLKMFRIRENTFQELAQRKLLAQDAEEQGLHPSDEQIRRRVMELSYFQKDGRFDPLTYRSILEANRMTPAQFEKMIREELLVQEWVRNLNSKVQVSEREAREEFLASKTQRNVKYVALPAAAAKQGELTVAQAAEKAAAMMRSDSASDQAINQLLKPFGVEVKKTEMISKNAGYLPGLGESADLLKDVFAKPSTIQSKAKVYQSEGQVVVALVIAAKEADPAQFEKEKKDFLTQVRSRKERALMDATLKSLTEQAKIRPNPEVAGEPIEG